MLIVHTFLPKRSQQFFPCHLLLHKTALTQTEKYKSDTFSTKNRSRTSKSYYTTDSHKIPNTKSTL